MMLSRHLSSFLMMTRYSCFFDRHFDEQYLAQQHSQRQDNAPAPERMTVAGGAYVGFQRMVGITHSSVARLVIVAQRFRHLATRKKLHHAFLPGIVKCQALHVLRG